MIKNFPRLYKCSKRVHIVKGALESPRVTGTKPRIDMTIIPERANLPTASPSFLLRPISSSGVVVMSVFGRR